MARYAMAISDGLGDMVKIVALVIGGLLASAGFVACVRSSDNVRAHKRNQDGSWSSFCPECILTIAKEELEIDLKAQEKNHACKGLDLLGLSIVGLPVRKMPELVIGYDYGPDKFAIAVLRLLPG